MGMKKMLGAVAVVGVMAACSGGGEAATSETATTSTTTTSTTTTSTTTTGTTTTPAPKPSATEQPGSAAFINWWRTARLGDLPMATADQDDILTMGGAACDSLALLPSLGEAVAFMSDALDTQASEVEVEALLRAAGENLCPEHKDVLGSAATSTQTPSRAPAPEQPGPAAFVNWAKTARLGDMSLRNATDEQLLLLGRAGCSMLDAAQDFPEAVQETMDATGTSPSAAEVEELLRRAAANLCPENSDMLP